MTWGKYCHRIASTKMLITHTCYSSCSLIRTATNAHTSSHLIARPCLYKVDYLPDVLNSYITSLVCLPFLCVTSVLCLQKPVEMGLPLYSPVAKRCVYPSNHLLCHPRFPASIAKENKFNNFTISPDYISKLHTPPWLPVCSVL